MFVGVWGAFVVTQFWSCGSGPGSARASRADFGASPKSLLRLTDESHWRGANDSTRGRVRSPEKCIVARTAL